MQIYGFSLYRLFYFIMRRKLLYPIIPLTISNINPFAILVRDECFSSENFRMPNGKSYPFIRWRKKNFLVEDYTLHDSIRKIIIGLSSEKRAFH